MALPAQLANSWLDFVEFRDYANWVSPGPLWYDPREDFEISEVDFDGPEGQEPRYVARAHLTIDVSWFLDEQLDTPAESPPFDLRITIGGDFTFVPGKDERFVRTWLEYNGAYLLWPYARAYISTFTAFGRHGKLTLGTRELVDPPDIETESEENAWPTGSRNDH